MFKGTSLPVSQVFPGHTEETLFFGVDAILRLFWRHCQSCMLTSSECSSASRPRFPDRKAEAELMHECMQAAGIAVGEVDYAPLLHGSRALGRLVASGFLCKSFVEISVDSKQPPNCYGCVHSTTLSRPLFSWKQPFQTAFGT